MRAHCNGTKKNPQIPSHPTSSHLPCPLIAWASHLGHPSLFLPFDMEPVGPRAGLVADPSGRRMVAVILAGMVQAGEMVSLPLPDGPDHALGTFQTPHGPCAIFLGLTVDQDFAESRSGRIDTGNHRINPLADRTIGIVVE